MDKMQLVDSQWLIMLAQKLVHYSTKLNYDSIRYWALWRMEQLINRKTLFGRKIERLPLQTSKWIPIRIHIRIKAKSKKELKFRTASSAQNAQCVQNRKWISLFSNRGQANWIRMRVSQQSKRDDSNSNEKSQATTIWANQLINVNNYVVGHFSNRTQWNDDSTMICLIRKIFIYN